MAHRAFWMVENRVLYIAASEQVTTDDIRLSTLQIADYMDGAYEGGSRLVIGVLDLRHADLSLFTHAAPPTTANEIAANIDPRIWKSKPGFIILITTSDEIKTIVSLVVRLAVQPMTMVGTLAEALTVAGYMYPELRDQLSVYQEGDLPAGAAH